MRSMSLLNADAVNAAGVIGRREVTGPITMQNSNSLVTRIARVSVCALPFPGSPLSRKAALVGALARGHRFGEVCIECGTNFFEPNLVGFHLLLWTDRESLHTLQNTNQPVHIPVPQKDFGV
jgi:hypothetical protein